METTPSQDSVNAAQAAVKKVKDATQKQSLEARIQYIANYYGLTYESDTAATQQTQTDANALMPTLTLWSSWSQCDSSTTTATTTVCSGCRCREKYLLKLVNNELFDFFKNKKHLAIKVPSCYNNRRYFYFWSLKSVQGRADKCCKSTHRW